jgi:hypothetical protein
MKLVKGVFALLTSQALFLYDKYHIYVSVRMLSGQEGRDMRRSKEEKQRTHKRIVEEAARQ